MKSGSTSTGTQATVSAMYVSPVRACGGLSSQSLSPVISFPATITKRPSCFTAMESPLALLKKLGIGSPLRWR